MTEEAPASKAERASLVRDLFRLRIDRGAARVTLVACCFGALFAVIGGRLVKLGFSPEQTQFRREAASEISAAPPLQQAAIGPSRHLPGSTSS